MIFERKMHCGYIRLTVLVKGIFWLREAVGYED